MKDLKILVAVDSSLVSTDVLNIVSTRGRAPGTEIHVNTVIEPGATWDATQQFLRRCEVILAERLKQLRALMPQCKVTGESFEGCAADLILEIAESWLADLIVIGSHGDRTKVRPCWQCGSSSREQKHRAQSR